MKVFATFLFASLATAVMADTTTTTRIVTTTTTVEKTTEVTESFESRKIAVFVVNRTRIPGMDDEIDGVRDRLSSYLAAMDGLIVMDGEEVVSAFHKYDVTTAEARANLVNGLFSGGSVSQVTKMLGCDYIALASITRASAMKVRTGVTYTLDMTLKFLDKEGASVGAMKPWKGRWPALDDAGDPLFYYSELVDRWLAAAEPVVAENVHKWRKVRATAAPVNFVVRTTVDDFVNQYESQTKGTSGELLQDLRKVVGGVTVELDGAVIGSSGYQLQATPGLHQLRVTRQWMKPYAATVNVTEGMVLSVALELDAEGIQKWGTLEGLRAALAKEYADAAQKRNVKINLDTTHWRDVESGSAARIILQND